MAVHGWTVHGRLREMFNQFKIDTIRMPGVAWVADCPLLHRLNFGHIVEVNGHVYLKKVEYEIFPLRKT